MHSVEILLLQGCNKSFVTTMCKPFCHTEDSFETQSSPYCFNLFQENFSTHRHKCPVFTMGGKIQVCIFLNPFVLACQEATTTSSSVYQPLAPTRPHTGILNPWLLLRSSVGPFEKQLCRTGGGWAEKNIDRIPSGWRGTRKTEDDTPWWSFRNKDFYF